MISSQTRSQSFVIPSGASSILITAFDAREGLMVYRGSDLLTIASNTYDAATEASTVTFIETLEEGDELFAIQLEDFAQPFSPSSAVDGIFTALELEGAFDRLAKFTQQLRSGVIELLARTASAAANIDLGPLNTLTASLAQRMNNIETRVLALEGRAELPAAPNTPGLWELSTNAQGNISWVLAQASSGGGLSQSEVEALISQHIPDLPTQNGRFVLNHEQGVYTFVTENAGGATTFLNLSDTPSGYVGGKFVRVNSAGTALEFVDAPTPADGSITNVQIAQGTILGEDIANDTITEDKLAPAVKTKLNATNGGTETPTNDLTAAIEDDVENFRVGTPDGDKKSDLTVTKNVVGTTQLEERVDKLEGAEDRFFATVTAVNPDPEGDDQDEIVTYAPAVTGLIIKTDELRGTDSGEDTEEFINITMPTGSSFVPAIARIKQAANGGRVDDFALTVKNDGSYEYIDPTGRVWFQLDVDDKIALIDAQGMFFDWTTGSAETDDTINQYPEGSSFNALAGNEHTSPGTINTLLGISLDDSSSSSLQAFGYATGIISILSGSTTYETTRTSDDLNIYLTNGNEREKILAFFQDRFGETNIVVDSDSLNFNNFIIRISGSPRTFVQGQDTINVGGVDYNYYRTPGRLFNIVNPLSFTVESGLSIEAGTESNRNVKLDKEVLKEGLGITELEKRDFVSVADSSARAALTTNDIKDGGIVLQRDRNEFFTASVVSEDLQFSPFLITQFVELGSSGQTVLEGSLARTGDKVYLAVASVSNVTSTNVTTYASLIDITGGYDDAELAARVTANESNISTIRGLIASFQRLTSGVIDSIITIIGWFRATGSDVTIEEGYSNLIDYRASDNQYQSDSGISYDTTNEQISGLGDSATKIIAVKISGTANHTILGYINDSGNAIPLVRVSNGNLQYNTELDHLGTSWSDFQSVNSLTTAVSAGMWLIMQSRPAADGTGTQFVPVVRYETGTVIELDDFTTNGDTDLDTIDIREVDEFKIGTNTHSLSHDDLMALLQHRADKWFFGKARLQEHTNFLQGNGGKYVVVNDGETGFGTADAPSGGGGGEENVQSDFNETDSSSDAFIKNKPLTPSVLYGNATNTSGATSVTLQKSNMLNYNIVLVRKRVGSNFFDNSIVLKTPGTSFPTTGTRRIRVAGADYVEVTFNQTTIVLQSVGSTGVDDSDQFTLVMGLH